MCYVITLQNEEFKYGRRQMNVEYWWNDTDKGKSNAPEPLCP
jgi:hypothetical protein